MTISWLYLELQVGDSKPSEYAWLANHEKMHEPNK